MDLRHIIRSIIKENWEPKYYFLDNEGYYAVPDPGKFINAIEKEGQLFQFWQMHYANLEMTKAKKAMEDAGLEQYDYPEGIDKIIRGGDTILGRMEMAITNRLGIPQSHLDAMKRDILRNPGKLIDEPTDLTT